MIYLLKAQIDPITFIIMLKAVATGFEFGASCNRLNATKHALSGIAGIGIINTFATGFL